MVTRAVAVGDRQSTGLPTQVHDGQGQQQAMIKITPGAGSTRQCDVRRVPRSFSNVMSLLRFLAYHHYLSA